MSETQNGLLKTRAELFNEAEQLTERLAAIKNNVAALDRTLRTVGYEGELDMIMPKYQRCVRFDQGDLAKAVIFELRYADRPLKSREIAENMLATKGIFGISLLWTLYAGVCRSLCVDYARRALLLGSRMRAATSSGRCGLVLVKRLCELP